MTAHSYTILSDMPMSAPLTVAYHDVVTTHRSPMMKTRRITSSTKAIPAFAGNDDQYLDEKYLPPEDEADLVSALLHRIADRGGTASVNYAYQDLDAENDGDAQALNHVVDELQFGHDLRM